MTATENKKLTIQREFDAPIDLVWRALTETDLLKQWAPFLGEFKAIVGYETRFLLGPDEAHQYLHICRVTDVVENERLTYTWSYEKIEGDSHVTFGLIPKGEKTDLVFTHEFVKPFPQDDPNFALGSFEQGWTYILGELQKFVEGGGTHS